MYLFFNVVTKEKYKIRFVAVGGSIEGVRRPLESSRQGATVVPPTPGSGEKFLDVLCSHKSGQ